MTARRSPIPLLFACSMLAASCVSQAQTEPAADTSVGVTPTTREAPIYDSANNVNRLSSARFTSPEDDARPGEYYFGLAVRALQKKNYSFAIHMYKVAASWAYKPAEYNLGVMYARGADVKQDLPRAMAWLTLAAERNDKSCVAARDLINTKLSDFQFKQANVIFAELKPTYGDETALVRAKARWAQMRASITGTRVGSLAGNLRLYRVTTSGGMDVRPGDTGMDGSLANSQLVSTNNPYDPKFEWRPGSQNVSVGPLSPVAKKQEKQESRPSPNSTSDPQAPPADDSSHR